MLGLMFINFLLHRTLVISGKKDNYVFVPCGRQLSCQHFLFLLDHLREKLTAPSSLYHMFVKLHSIHVSLIPVTILTLNI